MKCLLVIAHPLADSLCVTLARQAQQQLLAAGHLVQVENLYETGFAPALSVEERQSYYHGPYRQQAVAVEIERLQWAEAIVLVFPTWWFGLPAILKGWFDRVWAPGMAYDHVDDFCPIKPRLADGGHHHAGFARLLMRRPVRRQLKTALLGTCAPQCRLAMLSIYRSERLDSARVEQASRRVSRVLDRLR